MRIVVLHDPSFQDYKLVKEKMVNITLLVRGDIRILTNSKLLPGTQLGEKWAFSQYITVERFYSKKRNLQEACDELMLRSADAFVAFWDGSCSSTCRLIQRAKELALKVRVIQYEE